MAQTIGIEEFARRICKANHRRDHDNAQPSEQTVPCGVHMANARAWYVLITTEGSKSLNVIIDCFPAKEPEHAVFGPGAELPCACPEEGHYADCKYAPGLRQWQGVAGDIV